MSELTETDKAIVKGDKWGMILAIPILICIGIAKCSGVDFRSDGEKQCDAKNGIWQAPRGAAPVCLRNDQVIEIERQNP